MYTTENLANYIYSYLWDVDPTSDLFDMESIHDLIEEVLLDLLEDRLSTEDLREMYKSKTNTGCFDDYLEEKYGEDYQKLLLEVKDKIMDEHIFDTN